jgi:ribosomal protein L19E
VERRRTAENGPQPGRSPREEREEDRLRRLEEELRQLKDPGALIRLLHRRLHEIDRDL